MHVYFWYSPWNVVDISAWRSDNYPKYQNVYYFAPSSNTFKIAFLLDKKTAGKSGAKRKDCYEFKPEH